MTIKNDVVKNSMFSYKTLYLKEVNVLILHVFKGFFLNLVF